MKHGQMPGHTRTPTARSYDNMRKRCLYPSRAEYADYGAQGVTICSRWLESFSNFFEDMGERPTYVDEHGKTRNKSLDRIDPFGNYEPGNCRWATAKEQAQNKRKKAKP